MSSVNLKDNIRYSGELNKLHPFERQRYIHNITKNDYLVNLKQKYSKGEYNLLISNLGKTIMDMYSGKIPEYYVDSFWINNIDNLKSIEDNIISFYFDNNGVREHALCSFYDTTVDEMDSLDVCLFRLTCRLVDIGLPHELL